MKKLKFLCILVMMGSIHLLNAQTEQLKHSIFEGCNYNAMVVNGTEVIASSRAGGIHISADSGRSWAYSGKGLDSLSNMVKDLSKLGNNLYCLTPDDNVKQSIYRSTDSGKNWSKHNITGLPSTITRIYGMGSANSRIFLLVNQGWDSLLIYYSTDGTNFQQGVLLATGGFNDPRILSISNQRLYMDDRNGNIIFTTTGTDLDTISHDGLGDPWLERWDVTGEFSNNILYCQNEDMNGDAVFSYNFSTKQWTRVNFNIPIGQFTIGIAATDDVLIIQTLNPLTLAFNIHRSINRGSSWITFTPGANDIIVMDRIVKISPSVLVSYAQEGVNYAYYSHDTGRTWNVGVDKLYNKSTISFAVSSYKGSGDISFYQLYTPGIGGIYRSDDFGKTWQLKNKGMTTASGMIWGKEVIAFRHQQDQVIVAIVQDPMHEQVFLYRSIDKGENWAIINTVPSMTKNISFAGLSEDKFILGVSDSWDFRLHNTVVYYLSGDGISYMPIMDGIDGSVMGFEKIHGFTFSGNEITLFAEGWDMFGYVDYVSTSSNMGNTWTTNDIERQDKRLVVHKVDRGNHHSKAVVAHLPDGSGGLLALRHSFSDGSYTDSLFIGNSSGLNPQALLGLPKPLSIQAIEHDGDFWYLVTSVGIYVNNNLNNTWKKESNSPFIIGTSAPTMVFVRDQNEANIKYAIIGTQGNGVWRFKHEQLGLNWGVVCAGDSFTLRAYGPDSSFAWRDGLGTNRTVKVRVTQQSKYSASAIDFLGFLNVDTTEVYILSSPTASFTMNKETQCFHNNDYEFTNASSNASSRVWDFGDGRTTTIGDPTHKYTKAGTFDVKLVVVSDQGCKDSIIKQAIVLRGADASITISGDTQFCEGSYTTLYANTGTGVSYKWLKDGQVISGQTSPFLTVSQSGKYNLLTIDNTTLCENTSTDVNIKANSSDFGVSFTASPRVMNTPPFLTAFSNLTPSPANYTWLWFFGDNVTSTEFQPFHTYTYNDNFDVTLIARHKTTGCIDTLTQTNFIITSGGSSKPCPIKPNINFSGSSLICYNDSLLISADTGWNYTYIWTLNGTVVPEIKTAAFYAKKSGEYRAIVTSPDCQVTSYPFVLSHFPYTRPLIQSEGVITPCSEDSMKLFVSTFYPAYLWSTKESGSSIYVKNSGDYFVTINDVQGCKITSEPFKVNTAMLEPPHICLVTVDPISKKNLIAWERPISTTIQYYNVYKETYQANVYEKIGMVPYDSVSVFVDENSNPLQKADRYRLSLVDSCSEESALSPFHKTIHLSASKGVGNEINLIWSHYEGMPFVSYKIYRGTKANELSLIDSITSNLNSYTDLNPPVGVAYYMLSIVMPDTCFPEVIRATANKNTGPFSQSISNMRDYSIAGTNYLEAFPLQLTLDSLAGTEVIEVFTNVSGVWSSTVNQTWLNLVEDQNDNTITVNYSTNSSGANRSATITISAAGVSDVLIPVVQAGTTSIDEHRKLSMLIYPNPAKDFVYLLLPEDVRNIQSVDIMDVTGRLVRSYADINTNMIKIDREELSRGLYLIRVTANDQQQIGKLFFE